MLGFGYAFADQKLFFLKLLDAAFVGSDHAGNARIKDTFKQRGNLLLAVVEDSASLGMGFRAYLSHVRSSLDIWERSGTAFVNGKDEKLNVDALKADDLWGFLGKKDQQPQGPKRYIDLAKIAVLDVYIKKKYPSLAETFGRSIFSPEVAAVLRSFFNRGLASEPKADFIEPWSGIYISTENMDASSIISARRKGDIPIFVIRAVMLHPYDRPDFCVAQKVIFPFIPDFINHESRDYSEGQKISQFIDHHSPRETIVYNGIALVAHGVAGGVNIRISLMLRDRTTYEPNLSQFVINRHDDGSDTTKRKTIFAYEENGNALSQSYYYCLNDKYNIHINRYSLKFLENWRGFTQCLARRASMSTKPKQRTMADSDNGNTIDKGFRDIIECALQNDFGGVDIALERDHRLMRDAQGAALLH